MITVALITLAVVALVSLFAGLMLATHPQPQPVYAKITNGRSIEDGQRYHGK